MSSLRDCSPGTTWTNCVTVTFSWSYTQTDLCPSPFFGSLGSKTSRSSSDFQRAVPVGALGPAVVPAEPKGCSPKIQPLVPADDGRPLAVEPDHGVVGRAVLHEVEALHPAGPLRVRVALVDHDQPEAHARRPIRLDLPGQLAAAVARLDAASQRQHHGLVLVVEPDLDQRVRVDGVVHDGHGGRRRLRGAAEDVHHQHEEQRSNSARPAPGGPTPADRPPRAGSPSPAAAADGPRRRRLVARAAPRSAGMATGNAATAVATGTAAAAAAGTTSRTGLRAARQSALLDREADGDGEALVAVGDDGDLGLEALAGSVGHLGHDERQAGGAAFEVGPADLKPGLVADAVGVDRPLLRRGHLE